MLIPVKYAPVSLAHMMKKFDCKTFVFSSSATVYGNPNSLPIKEDFPLSATNAYGRSKLIIEELLKDIFNSDVPIKYIGTRHGEKLFETLVNREEMAKVNESQNYFQIAYDDRDLNYEKFYNSESDIIDEYEDYNSHNTEQLDFSSLKELLYSTEYVRDMLK